MLTTPRNIGKYLTRQKILQNNEKILTMIISILILFEWITFLFMTIRLKIGLQNCKIHHNRVPHTYIHINTTAKY